MKESHNTHPHSSHNMEIMTHVVAGYRNEQETKTLVEIMSTMNVSYIEVQIPFSDPIGDGSTITYANQIALDNGMTVDKALVFLESMAKQVHTPLLIVTYANIVYNMGIDAFIKRASNIGVQGIIIPDMCYGIEGSEESEELFKASQLYAMPLIPVLSPNTSIARMKLISSYMNTLKKLMVYCTRRVGITGTHTDRTASAVQDTQQTEEYNKYLRDVKTYFDTKVACGFGIQSSKQIEALSGHADIAVIGSHIINLYKDTSQDTDMGMHKVRAFLSSII